MGYLSVRDLLISGNGKSVVSSQTSKIAIPTNQLIGVSDSLTVMDAAVVQIDGDVYTEGDYSVHKLGTKVTIDGDSTTLILNNFGNLFRGHLTDKAAIAYTIPSSLHIGQGATLRILRGVSAAANYKVSLKVGDNVVLGGTVETTATRFSITAGRVRVEASGRLIGDGTNISLQVPALLILESGSVLQSTGNSTITVHAKDIRGNAKFEDLSARVHAYTFKCGLHTQTFTVDPTGAQLLFLKHTDMFGFCNASDNINVLAKTAFEREIKNGGLVNNPTVIFAFKSDTSAPLYRFEYRICHGKQVEKTCNKQWELLKDYESTLTIDYSFPEKDSKGRACNGKISLQDGTHKIEVRRGDRAHTAQTYTYTPLTIFTWSIDTQEPTCELVGELVGGKTFNCSEPLAHLEWAENNAVERTWTKELNISTTAMQFWRRGDEATKMIVRGVDIAGNKGSGIVLNFLEAPFLERVSVIPADEHVVLYTEPKVSITVKCAEKKFVRIHWTLESSCTTAQDSWPRENEKGVSMSTYEWRNNQSMWKEPGEYKLTLWAEDKLGSQSPPVAQTWSVQRCPPGEIQRNQECKTFDTPFDVRLKKREDRDDVVTVHWSFTVGKDASEVTSFEVRFSNTKDFSDNSQTTAVIEKVANDMSSTQIRLFDGTALFKTALFFQVRAMVGQQAGSWSSSATQNVVASDCDKDHYLNDSSVSTDKWNCVECPNGGHCDGNVRLDQVIPKFGYARCSTNPRLFSLCPFPAACIGGTNPALENKYEFEELNKTKEFQSRNETCNLAFVKGSRLCSTCAKDYSHKGLTGRCDKCPEVEQNYGFAIGGILSGLVGLTVFVRITLGDKGKVSASDGLKSIGMTYVQLLSLMTTFPVSWPDFFVHIFQIGGTVAVLGAHLVDYKCMTDMDDAETFYTYVAVWAVLPFVLVLVTISTWFFVASPVCHCCFRVTDLRRKIMISIVALVYLIYPTLCSTTFSLFACRDVCDDGNFLSAAMEEPCWSGRHLDFVLGLGVPMFLVFVAGLPLVATFMVYRLLRAIDEWTSANPTVIDEENKSISSQKYKHNRFFSNANLMAMVTDSPLQGTHQALGMLYTSYREEVWWWELTVVLRKVVVACIGVFGASLGEMQVHTVLLYVVLNMMATAIMKPYGGKSAHVLHGVEMMSLLGLFLTLWAGSVFNAHPKCVGDEGAILGWCEMLSLLVGVFDICVVVVVVIALLKVSRDEKREEDAVAKKKEDEDKGRDVDAKNMTENPLNLGGGENGGGKTADSVRKERSDVAISFVAEEDAKISVSIEMRNMLKKSNHMAAKMKTKGMAKKKKKKQVEKKGERVKVNGDVGGDGDGDGDGAAHLRKRTQLPDGWQKLETGEGKKYYANPQTRQSSWTPPPGSTGGSTRLSITQVEKQLDL